MWVMIWILLTGFVVGVYVWTTMILFQQKKAWKTFATKARLGYIPGKTMEPPVINGMINGRRVSFFTYARATSDVRGQRLITAIEVGLGEGMPTAAALATPEYMEFLSSLRMNESFFPEDPDWKPEYIVRTRDSAALSAYLTPERVKALLAVFKLKGASALFFFDEIDAVLRLETSDPLRNAERMGRLLKSLMATLDRLSPTDEEKVAGAGRASTLRDEQKNLEAAQRQAAAPPPPPLAPPPPPPLAAGKTDEAGAAQAKPAVKTGKKPKNKS